MNEEFHKPFIKSLIFVAVITIVTLYSTRFIAEIYNSSHKSSVKTLEYSSQKSQDNLEQR
jgi:hypothetical protein